MARRSTAALHLAIAIAISSLVLSAGSQAPAPGSAARTPRIPQDVRDRAARSDRVRVIVELNRTGARLPSKLTSRDHHVHRRFRTAPYLALEVTAAGLAALETSPGDVVRVMSDPLVRPLLTTSVPLIQGDQVWAQGVDGSGTLIAILDTGVDAAHPFLAGKVVEEACYSSQTTGVSQSFCPNGLGEQIGAGSAAPCPLDDCIHGTHVAGIAAGNGGPAGQPFSGVAKGAQLMAVQVFSKIVDPVSCGGIAPCLGAFTSDIIAALERVQTVAPQHNIAAVNMSLGGGSFAGPCDDEPYKPVIDSLRSIGIATVVASGNNGSPASMATPGCVSSAVSVGSTDRQDRVSWFSNVTPFLKLFAPGESIAASVPGGGYTALSGTSMATPHVAGAWALMSQAVPGASVDTILAALRQTGLPVADTRAGGSATVPRVRVFEALASLASITNASPLASSLSPARMPAGAGFTLTVDGSGFNAFSVVRWNGVDKPTKAESTYALQASISATDVAVAGEAEVIVFNPAPGGGVSSALTFTIDPSLNAVPVASSLSPSRVFAGASAFALIVNGNNFIASSAVGWNGAARPTTFVSATQLQATIAASDVAAGGVAQVTVFTPSPGGGTSSALPFTIDAPPALTVSATTATAGGPLTVTLTGSSGANGDWLALAASDAPDTSYLQWTYVGSGVTSRTWTIAMPGAGIYEFRLFLTSTYNRAATSAAVTVTGSLNPAPIASSLSPSRAFAGGSALSLTVSGSAFIASSIVHWNGAPRPTTFLNANQLRASIAAGDLASIGTAQITVVTPTPGGGTSSAIVFTIDPPPTLTVG